MTDFYQFNDGSRVPRSYGTLCKLLEFCHRGISNGKAIYTGAQLAKMIEALLPHD